MLSDRVELSSAEAHVEEIKGGSVGECKLIALSGALLLLCFGSAVIFDLLHFTILTPIYLKIVIFLSCFW